jgi:bifunctional UDP-N-acetylglucosamine pyrophosphorylase / glucosamine-1-phosphate N-acetyltransferase
LTKGEFQVDATQRPLALIVLAAGDGTRMRSERPKVLHQIGGRSLLSHVLHAAVDAGPREIVTVIGPEQPDVEAEARAVAPGAHLAVQPHARGTGDAARVGLEQLDGFVGTVVVLYGDVPLVTPELLTELTSSHEAGGVVVTVLTAEFDDPYGYGRIIRAANGSVERIVEQRDADAAQQAIREVNSGVMAFDATVLRDALAKLDIRNAQGELYLTDVVALARRGGGGVQAVLASDVWQTEGCNDRSQLARLGAELNRRVCEAWMRAGVTIVDPASTWIDVDVRLANDVTLHPGVQLQGDTRVAGGAVIGPNTTLRDVIVGESADVVRTHGTSAVVGASASVGPFAYLRPGTVIDEAGKVGTFVETKNSRIGPGAKVPHLSYVGDADIGEGTNIGAGTIFANYDGVRKHHTVIGQHCRTGSDNVFVAPVTVGDGVATGAGSVIRRDVPPGALAVSTGPQRHLDGWVEKRWPGSPTAKAAEAARGTAEPASPSAAISDKPTSSEASSSEESGAS